MAKCVGHKWMLNLSMNPNVFCSLCYVQFKPENQQIPYYGVVPNKFKDNQNG